MSIARTIPEFTTTVTLEILATVAGDTQEEAQDALELLGNTIEVAIFGSQKIVGLCQQFTTALTEVDINADGSSHIGRAKITIDCETFEAFDPALLNPATTPNLARIGIHLDLAAPFDATGTYVDPPFPGSVNPAPRTIGPDGRDEATLVIDIPT